MPPLHFPGVYVVETARPFPAIDPVATAVAVFIGASRRGPVARARQCRDYATFARIFGEDARAGELPRQVRLFFENGGAECFVMRLARRSASGRWSYLAAPRLADYNAAFRSLDAQVDSFNLMILPPAAGQGAAEIAKVQAAASRYCRQRRAFLLMDAPPWPDATTATAEVASLRSGLVLESSAIFFPRLIVEENGTRTAVGPAGAIAGICARIDAARGVWKAPAGVEAEIRGVVDVEVALDHASSSLLNGRAINAVRAFPHRGILSWGARTNAGDAAGDYRYIPTRRLALFIEESLTRGLAWSVFEPDAAPLWAAIRASAEDFLQELFRKGAFPASTPCDAFFVRCGPETTTAADRALGILRALIGFAPTRPAEFVTLELTLKTAS